MAPVHLLARPLIAQQLIFFSVNCVQLVRRLVAGRSCFRTPMDAQIEPEIERDVSLLSGRIRHHKGRATTATIGNFSGSNQLKSNPAIYCYLWRVLALVALVYAQNVTC